MVYRIKIVCMIDGKRQESWLVESTDLREGGSHYNRPAAVGIVEMLWTQERRKDTGLVAVELVCVT